MDALLTDKNNKIDAFLCPGHVSVIIGSNAYKPIVEKFKKPCVVAGFEPMQIIEGIAEICRQIVQCKPEVKSMYPAVVTPQGNIVAQNIINEIFEPADGYWRGLGLYTEKHSETQRPSCAVSMPKSVSVLRSIQPKIPAAAAAARCCAA